MSYTNLDIEIPPFARECIEEASDSWGASFEHPFVLALADGSLDSDIFKFYQMQDARYLEAFSEAASLISTRCADPDDKLWFLESAQIALVTEKELHAGYGEKLGYTMEDVAEIELTPNNRAYQNHVVSEAATGSLVEAVGALTPCPWLYIELGQHLLDQLGEIEDDHPYSEWLEMYSDPEFVDFVDNLLGRLQKFADQHGEPAKQRARDAFHASARYEYMFWQQAWEKQEWPV